MAVWVLILYALYFLIVFVLRSWIHMRQTGSSPVKKVRAAPFSVGWYATVLLMAGSVLGTAAPFLEIAGLSRPIPDLDSALVHTIGFVLFAMALALMFWSQLTMGASWRIGVDWNERTKLVVHGVFSLVRNPIYSSGLLMAVALLLILPDPWLIAALGVQFAGLELQVRGVEEPWLQQTHGPAFAAYARTVGRFVPGIGKNTSVTASRSAGSSQ